MKLNNAKGLILAYYLSAFDQPGARVFTSLNCSSLREAFRLVANTFNLTSWSAVKRMRDQLDPLTGSTRQGYKGEPVPSRQKVVNTLSPFSKDEVLEIATKLLAGDVDPRISDLLDSLTASSGTDGDEEAEPEEPADLGPLTLEKVLADLEPLVGESLQRVNDKHKVKLVEITGSTVTVWCPTDKNADPHQDKWEKPILAKWIDKLNTRQPVHYDRDIHGGGGTNRFGVETLLANLPYIEWVFLKEDGQGKSRHLVYAGRASHELGTLHQIEPEDLAAPTTPPPAPAVTFDFDFERIREAIESAGLHFRAEDLALYHLGMTASKHRHFALLAGISGTGKTSLARAYANAVYHMHPLAEKNPAFLKIEVEANWHDDRPLLGFYNQLQKRYERRRFLDFVLEASKPENQGRPFFVCLDEMNLARVEFYFARILSAMELPEPFRIHDNQPGATDEGVPVLLDRYPPNLYLTGTLNTDESTQPISDKVLDRAVRIELFDVNLDDFVTTYKKAQPAAAHKLIEKIQADLTPVQDALEKVQFHMGYRALTDVFNRLLGAQEPAIAQHLPYQKALDGVLRDKVLAKLRGDDSIKETLQTLHKELKKLLADDAYCTARINQMIHSVGTVGIAKFGR